MEQNVPVNNSGMSPLIVGGIVIALLVLVTVIVIGNRGEGPDSAVPQNENIVESTMVVEDVDSVEDVLVEDNLESEDVKVIEVEGGSFYYDPDIITVTQGDAVKIVFTSVDMMHDFVIDELDVRTEIIKSGETVEVEFTADKAGKFEFYCSVGAHREQGMVGTLVVNEGL